MNQTTTKAQFTDYVAARQVWLRRLAYLLCQDWHRADDLVQTCLTKLYLNWRRIDEMGSPDGYARAVLVNTFLAEQRSPWWKRVVLHREADGAAEVEQAAFDRGGGQAGPDLEGAADLRRALALLPPKQRAAIVLRYYCELSVVEAAEALGCSAGTVKSQTFRAIETLRRLMHVEELGDGAAAGRRSDVSDVAGPAAAMARGEPQGTEGAERARPVRLLARAESATATPTTTLGGFAAAHATPRGGTRDGL